VSNANPYQFGPQVVWPDVEVLVRWWFMQHIPGTNVRTETDATFGTSSPNSSMALPLILIQNIPGGSLDATYTTQETALDVDCFAADRASTKALMATAHAWLLRLVGQPTPYGVVDDVTVALAPGAMNYNNPDLRRFTASYRIASRAQATV